MTVKLLVSSAAVASLFFAAPAWAAAGWLTIFRARGAGEEDMRG